LFGVPVAVENAVEALAPIRVRNEFNFAISA